MKMNKWFDLPVSQTTISSCLRTPQVCGWLCTCPLYILCVLDMAFDMQKLFSVGDNRISLVWTKCSSVKLNQLESCCLWAGFGYCNYSSVFESKGDIFGHGASHKTPSDNLSWKWDYFSWKQDYSLSNLLLIHFYMDPKCATRYKIQ